MVKTISNKTSNINNFQYIVRSESNIASTLNEVAFEDWKDVLEELSNPDIIKSIIQARKEYQEKEVIPYKKIYKK